MHDEIEVSVLVALLQGLAEDQFALPERILNLPLPELLLQHSAYDSVLLHATSCTHLVGPPAQHFQHRSVAELVSGLGGLRATSPLCCTPPRLHAPHLIPGAMFAWRHALVATRLTRGAAVQAEQTLAELRDIDPRDELWITLVATALDELHRARAHAGELVLSALADLPVLVTAHEELRAAAHELEERLTALVETTWGEGRLEALLGLPPSSPTEAVLAWGAEGAPLQDASLGVSVSRILRTLTPLRSPGSDGESAIFCLSPELLAHVEDDESEVELHYLGSVASWGGTERLVEAWEVACEILGDEYPRSATRLLAMLETARDLLAPA